MSTQYGFFIDSARCTGCKTCELACKDYKDLTRTSASAVFTNTRRRLAGGQRRLEPERLCLLPVDCL